MDGQTCIIETPIYPLCPKKSPAYPLFMLSIGGEMAETYSTALLNENQSKVT